MLAYAVAYKGVKLCTRKWTLFLLGVFSINAQSWSKKSTLTPWVCLLQQAGMQPAAQIQPGN